MPRFRAKVDRNQSEIMSVLRSVGPHVSVRSLAGQGQGIPDLLCGISGVTFLIEVKDGAKAPSRQKLTPDQESFISSWTGSPVVILRDENEAREWAIAQTGVAIDIS
jgi:Holliday junction resolvase